MFVFGLFLGLAAGFVAGFCFLGVLASTQL